MGLIKLDKDKTIIPAKEVTYYLNPDYIYVPITPKNILVSEGERIYKNQVISKLGDKSPVSGKILGMKKCNIMGNGKNTLVIANDFREIGKLDGRKKKVSIPGILKVLEENKNYRLLAKFKSNIYKYIVVSAIDDSPYVYNKIFTLKERIIDVLDFMQNLSILYKCDDVSLVIKSNESFLIDECLNVIGSYPNVKLTLVNDEYLLEDDIVLQNRLKIKGNVLMLNVLDIVTLRDLINNQINTFKMITISGDAIDVNKVLKVKKYSSLKSMVDKYIEINTRDYQVIINNLMNGILVDNLEDVIISDEVESIHFMKKRKKFENKCIRCGKCIRICPKGVNPVTLENKEKCIHCGLCSYICPSYIDLNEKLKR